jgi:D-alanyl-D-alanine-carboxypeptidase/D-alanyl-D-alanine-endopeptidase
MVAGHVDDDLLAKMVEPYLRAQPKGLGFAIGYAGPNFDNYGRVRVFGNLQNQFGADLCLSGETPFEIASITKTFTATLYARLIRSVSSNQTLADYLCPKGPFTNERLARMSLDCLVNYTSGLPQDNDDAGANAVSPPYWPRPYSMQGMVSFLNNFQPNLPPPDDSYTYSNLAFSIMSAIIASDGTSALPAVHSFTGKMREYVFRPLGIGATFFNQADLGELPLGFSYRRDSSDHGRIQPGHTFFPAYFGGAGIVATPNDMFKWLLFNMGLTRDAELTPLLPHLHGPSTTVTMDPAETDVRYELGLGWFISPKGCGRPASICKDGELDGFASYIAFLPSSDPGKAASQAGAFVLVNADGITKDGKDIALVIANDLLLCMQNQEPPADKSVYPRSPSSVARPV